MHEKTLLMVLTAVAVLGCTNDTRPGTSPAAPEDYVSGFTPEASIDSLSDADRLAMCEDASRWLNDNVDLVRLAGISQALQGDADVAMCEERIALYEEVSTGADGMVPVFSEGCATVSSRLASCAETVGSFEALMTWWAMDVEWQLSMLSCDLITMPDVWRDISWGSAGRTPAELDTVRRCASGG